MSFESLMAVSQRLTVSVETLAALGEQLRFQQNGLDGDSRVRDLLNDVARAIDPQLLEGVEKHQRASTLALIRTTFRQGLDLLENPERLRAGATKTRTFGRFMTYDFFLANRLDEDHEVFHTRFWRCHRLLHFIACRVLGSSERADGAIANCWMTASRNPPRFEYQGAFRSWLVRVLIDEALAILRQNQPTAQGETRLRRNSLGARNQLYEKRILLMKAATQGEY